MKARETAGLPERRPKREAPMALMLLCGALGLGLAAGLVGLCASLLAWLANPAHRDHGHHAEHVGTGSSPEGPRARPLAASPQPPAVTSEPTATLVAGVTKRVELGLLAEHFPAGWHFKPGKPYGLSREPPPGVIRPPPGVRDPIFYGAIPLPRAPVLFAITCPSAPKQRATLWVDRDRDGILGGGDDDPPSYDGTGTSLTAANLDLDLPRPDGARHPYRIWLWTSLEGGPPPAEAGFNFYAASYRASRLVLPTVPAKHVHLRVPDPDNDGEFASKRVWIDWNDDRKAQDVEWMAAGESRRFAGIALALEGIEPFAAAVALRADAEGALATDAPRVEEELDREPLPGNAPPPLDTRDLAGHPVDLAEHAGKVVLVDFWATWCAPCIRELPAVRAAYDRFHGRGLEVVGISLDKDPAKLRDFLSREGIPWHQSCDGLGWESPVAKRWKVRSIPATFLLGRDGRIIATDLRGEALEKAVEKALGGE